MKALALINVLAIFAVPCQAANSSFATVEFTDIAQVALPRNWTYLDKNIAAHLNTSSEAVARIAGFSINQDNNKILVSASAYDTTGNSLATIRLSVRTGQSLSQQEFRELANQSPLFIQEALLPAGKEVADAMLRVPGIRSYKVIGAKFDYNGALYCDLLIFEYNHSGRVVISETRTCPFDNRTIKLATSYEKINQAIYQPTINYVWRSLSAKQPR